MAKKIKTGQVNVPAEDFEDENRYVSGNFADLLIHSTLKGAIGFF